MNAVTLMVAALVGTYFMSQTNKILPRGIRNNNPGNIRITQDNWKGKVPAHLNTDGAFEQFADSGGVSGKVWGIRALARDLSTKINRGLNTIEKIITVYAPPNENNTTNYIKMLAQMTSINPNKPITTNDIPKIVPAIIRIENGQQPYPQSILKQAYALV